MSEEAGTPADAPPAKSGNKILPIILVVNTLLLSGVLLFVMKRPSAQAAAKGEHGEKGEHGDKKGEGEKGEGEKGDEAGGDADAPGPTLRLDGFIVQVRSADGDRYAHLTMEVEVGSESDKKAFEARMPRIRDSVISYLSDRTEDELRGSEGLTAMKEALLKRLDEIVPGHRVRGLFTTEFIIQ